MGVAAAEWGVGVEKNGSLPALLADDGAGAGTGVGTFAGPDAWGRRARPGRGKKEMCVHISGGLGGIRHDPCTVALADGA